MIIRSVISVQKVTNTNTSLKGAVNMFYMHIFWCSSGLNNIYLGREIFTNRMTEAEKHLFLYAIFRNRFLTMYIYIYICTVSFTFLYSAVA
jgi:hypothetical protein